VGAVDGDAWRALAPARAALARARQAHAELVFGGGVDFAARLDAALADARDAAVQAEASSAYVSAAIARTLEARLLARRGDTTAAEIAASHAVEHASAIDDPVLRTIAMLQRVYAIGAAGSRIAEARALAEQASASIVAAGDPPLLRGQLENNLGLVVARDGDADRDEAIEHHRRAIERFTAALGDAHPDTMAARVNLGSALARIDRTDEALAELDPIVAPAIAVWGEDHPSTARLFGVIGNAWLRKGELATAESWLRRALDSALRFAPGDAEVANAEYNLATALRRRMDDEEDGAKTSAAVAAATEAVTLLRAAIAIRERLEATDPVNLIAYRVALGEAELGAGNPSGAEAELRQALSTCERTGAAALDFARVRLALGRAIADRDPAEARVLVRAAREAFVAEGRTAAVQTCDRVLARLAAP
jgi:tetratricopeptide (TPR) repeat protein